MNPVTEKILIDLGTDIEKRNIGTIAIDGHGNKVRWEDKHAIDVRFQSFDGAIAYAAGALIKPFLKKHLPIATPEEQEEIIGEVKAEIFAMGRRLAMKDELDEPTGTVLPGGRPHNHRNPRPK